MAEEQEPSPITDYPDDNPWTAGAAGERDIPASGTNLINIAMGLGLAILGPVFTGATGVTSDSLAQWNSIIVGLLIAFVGFLGNRSWSPVFDAIQVALGLWLMVAVFIPGYGGGNEGWDTLVVGAIVAFVGLIGVVMKSTAGERRRRGPA
jgi:peptidoglycan/LPS O-acetylase OafA/YrhL